MRHDMALWARTPLTAFDKHNFQADRKIELTTSDGRIRCPVCRWNPEKKSRWWCGPMGHPEYFSGGCGCNWNTFETRGRCPGCSYQWQYTSCLRCAAVSLHEDWYETGDKPPASP